MERYKVAIVFGAVLRALRKKRSLSQEKLGFDAELERTYIHKLERGQRLPSLTTMLALSRALEIPLAHLSALVEEKLKETDEPPNPEPNT